MSPERPLITVSHVLQILRARWRSIAGTAALALAFGLAALYFLPAQYVAEATVLVDIKSPDPISGLMAQGLTAPSYMNTQVDLITSDATARRVVRDLQLAQSPKWAERWKAASRNAADFEGWMAKALARNLEVSPTRDSNLLRVGFKSDDPKFAAQVANAFVKAYIDTTLELRVAPARQSKTFFDARSRQLRDELETAQSKLSAYQQKHGLIGNDETLDVENARLNGLTTQLVSLQSEAANSSSRKQQSRVGAEYMPEALASDLMVKLRTDLQLSRSRLSELLQVRGERHPQVLQLKASIAELNARIAEETRRFAGGALAVDQVNQRRLADLQAAVARQTSKVLEMKASRDEAAVLRRDVEGAQRAYDSVLGRASQMGLESQAGQTNVSIIGPVPVPAEPSSPNAARTLGSALLLGLLAGLGLALVREVRDPRIRTDQQAATLLMQPVVTTIPSFGRGALSLLPSRRVPLGLRAERLLRA
ncbi:MAG: GNVR domain-containing protein [Burkholderiaceae bacterium]